MQAGGQGKCIDAHTKNILQTYFMQLQKRQYTVHIHPGFPPMQIKTIEKSPKAFDSAAMKFSYFLIFLR